MNIFTRHQAIQDLVFTIEPEMVDEVVSLGSFGTSDYNMMAWEMNMFSTTKGIYDYIVMKDL